MEEAAVFDEFPGGGPAEARRGGAGGDERLRSHAAAANHAEIRTRANGGLRHRGRLALADAATGGGHEPRNVLAADAPLAGERYAGARGFIDHQAGAVRRWPRAPASRGSRYDVPADQRRTSGGSNGGAGRGGAIGGTASGRARTGCLLRGLGRFAARFL